MGTISVTANVLPHEMRNSYRRSQTATRQRERNRCAQPMSVDSVRRIEPATHQVALHLMGKIDTGIRLPLLPMSEGTTNRTPAARGWSIVI
jgi:dihydrodipicolinate synthase/N-acetylneuraminate lyase